MQAVTTIGFDIAKSVFQVHGVNTVGQVIIRRQLKRRQVIAFFQKLPACYVRPYVKRQKNDMADAEAICEAVTRANMRFVSTQTAEQQSGLMHYRTRGLFMRQQISVINRSALILPSLALSHRLGAEASRNCCVWLLIQATNGAVWAIE
jgi:transposase